ncbi:hypothetical protein TNCV_5133841 [Trichonephila clavipes]|nr:hypothetical protein TNCV_5133841 [Trichonephila clavipes]
MSSSSLDHGSKLRGPSTKGHEVPRAAGHDRGYGLVCHLGSGDIEAPPFREADLRKIFRGTKSFLGRGSDRKLPVQMSSLSLDHGSKCRADIDSKLHLKFSTRCDVVGRFPLIVKIDAERRWENSRHFPNCWERISELGGQRFGPQAVRTVKKRCRNIVLSFSRDSVTTARLKAYNVYLDIVAQWARDQMG